MRNIFSNISQGRGRWVVAPLLLLLTCVCTGCLKNEVQVKFEFTGVPMAGCQLQYYASDSRKGWFVETGATVQNGKGAVTLYTRNPTLVFITVSSDIPEAAFYAERGDDITIEGSEASPYGWKIGGNKINEEWTAWRLENRSALMNRLPEGVNAAVRKFVSKNSDNPLSAILLLLYYNRRVDEAGFQKLYSSLKGDARDAEWQNLVSAADMVNGDFPAAEGVKSMVLRTAGNGADTVVMGRRAAAFFFWRSADRDRGAGVAMLKSLAKGYPDSASRLLADICFEPDSTSWRYSAANDSLTRVIRAWNPLAECDSIMTRMRVPRTPYCIVYDRRGRELYRGSDFSKGEAAFRSAMPK